MKAAIRATCSHSRRSQISLLFEPVQDGVQHSGADLVTMLSQFLHHRETIDWLLSGMMENVESD